jgi:ATP-dependent Zn protease
MNKTNNKNSGLIFLLKENKKKVTLFYKIYKASTPIIDKVFDKLYKITNLPEKKEKNLPEEEEKLNKNLTNKEANSTFTIVLISFLTVIFIFLIFFLFFPKKRKKTKI